MQYKKQIERKRSNRNIELFIIIGGCNKTGQAGIGFIVMKKTRKCILGFETYNEGICILKIIGKYNKITTINLQAPCVLYTGQAFRYCTENAFYIFNQQIYFII